MEDQKITSRLTGMVAYSICAIAILAASCATIIHGTTQDVGISSSPSGATVTVNNQAFGTTPTIANLKRKDSHIVKIQLDGYLPYEATLTRQVSGWVWGNIIFGGLVGLAVDAISGGLYKLTPDQIQATLARGMPGFQPMDDFIYIIITLHPEPSWEQIASIPPLLSH